jgi:hypothetical protein
MTCASRILYAKELGGLGLLSMDQMLELHISDVLPFQILYYSGIINLSNRKISVCFYFLFT